MPVIITAITTTDSCCAEIGYFAAELMLFWEYMINKRVLYDFKYVAASLGIIMIIMHFIYEVLHCFTAMCTKLSCGLHALNVSENTL